MNHRIKKFEDEECESEFRAPRSVPSEFVHQHSLALSPWASLRAGPDLLFIFHAQPPYTPLYTCILCPISVFLPRSLDLRSDSS